MTDNELVQAYLAGDESAVTATKEKYRHYLYKISFQILGDNEDVEECMNDVYLAAWKSIPQDKPEMLLPYLRKITRRISIDKLRMRSSKKRIPSEYLTSIEELNDTIPSDHTPESEVEAEALNEAIRRFAATLSAEERRLFIGRYYFFDPLKEVAQYCGISESKAKSSLFRLRKRLKEFLKEEGFDI